MIEPGRQEILLNGEPILPMGALDQDLYPLGMSAPANGREAIKAQFAQALAIGLNLIRCHIKVPDPTVSLEGLIAGDRLAKDPAAPLAGRRQQPA